MPGACWRAPDWRVKISRREIESARFCSSCVRRQQSVVLASHSHLVADDVFDFETTKSSRKYLARTQLPLKHDGLLPQDGCRDERDYTKLMARGLA